MPAQLGKSLFAGNVVAPAGELAFGRAMKVIRTPDYPSTEGIAVANKTKKETCIKMIAPQAGLGLAFCQDEASSYLFGGRSAGGNEQTGVGPSTGMQDARFDISLGW